MGIQLYMVKGIWKKTSQAPQQIAKNGLPPKIESYGGNKGVWDDQ